MSQYKGLSTHLKSGGDLMCEDDQDIEDAVISQNSNIQQLNLVQEVIMNRKVIKHAIDNIRRILSAHSVVSQNSSLSFMIECLQSLFASLEKKTQDLR
jgi:organic radical activating enzyme